MPPSQVRLAPPGASMTVSGTLDLGPCLASVESLAQL